uniref:Uncharacterized protein n=1 Tax=Anguilla anguilla TaxID=7936 RepID=A0A0E9UWN8_ANGAN
MFRGAGFPSSTVRGTACPRASHKVDVLIYQKHKAARSHQRCHAGDYSELMFLIQFI